MARIALTGANGFLGWHTRSAAHALGFDWESIAVGDAFDLNQAVHAIDGAARLIHIAGVNRADDDGVREGNRQFAQQISDAVQRSAQPPAVIVFANSTQVGNGSIYGDSKEAAADILRAAASVVGATFVDLKLPNLFGEHGRPFYNSVVATFCHLLAEGGQPRVEQDRELSLLHAQNAAELLLGVNEQEAIDALQEHETVSGLLARLSTYSRWYHDGDIPDVSNAFDRDLFNTFRSFTFPAQTPLQLTRHADERGSFFEIVRSHGGAGQSSFSTTVPGITRGEHFHMRKIERFTVLAGEAVISLRKLFTSDVYRFPVSGAKPEAIDMPTMWVHNITNVGTTELYTSFWSNEIFNPARPDTFAEAV